MIWQSLESVVDWLPIIEKSWIFSYWIVLSLLAATEIVIPAFQQAPHRHQRWPTNFGIGILNIGVATLAPVTAVVSAQWAQSKGLGLLNVTGAPIWIAVIATIAIRSLAGYTFHFLMHKVRLFWQMHRVHHSDTRLDVSTSLRHHPLEIIAMFFTMTSLAVLFGLNPLALAAFEVFESIINAISHANLRLPERIDRPLRWLFVTPNMHCLHHSSYQPETDSNYGQVFSIWDRMFGTYSAAPKAGYDAMEIGLKEIRDDRASDIVWQLKSPLIRSIESANETSAEIYRKS